MNNSNGSGSRQSLVQHCPYKINVSDRRKVVMFVFLSFASTTKMPMNVIEAVSWSSYMTYAQADNDATTVLVVTGAKHTKPSTTLLSALSR